MLDKIELPNITEEQMHAIWRNPGEYFILYDAEKHKRFCIQYKDDVAYLLKMGAWDYFKWWIKQFFGTRAS